MSKSSKKSFKISISGSILRPIIFLTTYVNTVALRHVNLLMRFYVMILWMGEGFNGSASDSISSKALGDKKLYFDFICLMAYDFHGSWEQTIDHNSPLYSRKSEYGDASYLNVDWAVNYWLKSGFPKEKFVLGLATYGRPFKLKDPNRYEPGDLNDGAGTPGRICSKIIPYKLVILHEKKDF
ncbi:chitotriosidase-1 isoform X2 [Brachionus plicatilis]|uniref:Chitotriosidase-1 isoform X2 n=1 Tax=Brachionus plicatilis TaxID=10195 RepID=A0A3M7PMU5_BRAPC|nr:chitotriosidase-1 isoform X2 [Brachionus plicatilis]